MISSIPILAANLLGPIRKSKFPYCRHNQELSPECLNTSSLIVSNTADVRLVSGDRTGSALRFAVEPHSRRKFRQPPVVRLFRLPGVPGSQDLADHLLPIGSWNRFELLQAS